MFLMVLRDNKDIPNDYNCVIRRLEPTHPVFVDQGLHKIIRVVVGGKEIPNVAIGEDIPLDRICRAERSWVVGLDHVAAAPETVRIDLHTHLPAGDWMMRAPANKEMKRGGC